MKIAVLGPVAKDFTTIDGVETLHIGGIPYYVAVTLKSLGVTTVVPYITANKDDESWIEKSFSGIPVQLRSVSKTLESVIEYSSSNPDRRRHHIEAYPNTIEASDTLLTDLERFDWIILGPLFHDNIPFELFSKFKHKKLVLGNFGMFTYGEEGQFVRKHPENVVQVLPYLQYLFLDRSEAEFVSGAEDILESGRFFQEHGLPNMIITEGSKGSHLFIGNAYYKIPAFPPTKLIDPTGAGDTYMAAFIRATELFADPEQQGKFAAMVATMSLENKGAFNGNLEEVPQRLETVTEN
jgi:sugar/nucleoside kinase (ribokinase family)